MIESLESRIAPAAILAFTDSDGDAITVKASKGTNAQLATAVARDGMGNITVVTLSSAIYEGSNFSITATTPHGSHGDGHIAVPIFNASGTDLGVVSIDGDVGSGAIGSNTAGTPAVKSFTALSLGITNSSLAPLVLDGVVPLFALKSDIGPSGGLIFGGSTPVGNLVGKIVIGGNIVGSGASSGGDMVIGGGVGSIAVKGIVLGGSANDTGSIVIGTGTGATPTRISVGSLIGNSGEFSGSIRATGPLGAVTVTGNIVAGTNTLSGSIISEKNISSITVGQSISDNSSADGEIAAGADISSGVLGGSDNLGKLTIKGSIAGEENSQYQIVASNDISSISIKGDADGATISSGGNIGAVIVGGSLLETEISAHGTGVGLALGSVVIHGSVRSADFFTGKAAISTQSVDTNATMGKISIAGDALGITIESGTAAGPTSRVASVTFAGPVFDVGIFSSDIVKLTVDGAAAPLTPGANNDNNAFGGVTYNET